MGVPTLVCRRGCASCQISRAICSVAKGRARACDFLAGLPLVLYAALPGQEEGSVDHVVGNGAGIWAPLPRMAARAVLQLLNDPEKRAGMAKKSLSLGRPFATEQIARELWQLARPRQQTNVGTPIGSYQASVAPIDRAER